MLSMIKGMQRADNRRALSYLSKARGELLHELSLEGPPEVKMDRGMWPAVTEAMLFMESSPVPLGAATLPKPERT